MALYQLSVTLHLLAAMLWLGHMFVWSLITGPALKRVEPPETAELLRERSVFLGAFGWPALAVLIPTGLYQLSMRGISMTDIATLAFLELPDGHVLAAKLLLVLWMVVYQAIWAHHRAPFAVYINMAAALVILAASVILVRGWE